MDVVVSDMAPNLSGIGSADAARISALVELAVDFAKSRLKPEGALVVKLPKAPGAREARWAHLLCGPVDLSAPSAALAAGGATEEEVIALTRRLAALEDTVEQLRAQLKSLQQQLGG